MDWEARYKAGDTPWEKGEPSPGLVEFLAQHPAHGRVLVPGSGFGHDVRAIADAGAGKAQVVGMDIAPSAVDGARALSPSNAADVRYEVGDIFALPPHQRGVFDWVWEHTCFCAIDPGMRERYVAGVAEALKPNGRFLAIFYLDPELEPGQSGPPFGVTLAELDVLFGSRFELLCDWLPKRAYPSRVGRERMQLHRRSD